MMSITLSNYKEAEFTCHSCGWKGLGRETEMGEVFSEVVEIDCPMCHDNITSLPFTRFTPVRHSIDESKLLKNAAQLPDIAADEIVINFNVGDMGSLITLFHNDTEIWREPTSTYKYMDRYYEIGDILKQKYGGRFADYIPCQSIYDYNDSISEAISLGSYRKSIIARE